MRQSKSGSLRGFDEGTTNRVVARRLGRLVEADILTPADPTHKQKAVYNLTDRRIDLAPSPRRSATGLRRIALPVPTRPPLPRAGLPRAGVVGCTDGIAACSASHITRPKI